MPFFENIKVPVDSDAVTLCRALNEGGVGLWEWDGRDKIFLLDKSAQEHLNFQTSACAQRTFWSGFLPEDRLRVAEQLQATGKVDVDLRRIQPDGTVRWIAMKGGCIAPLWARGICFDTTEANREGERLRNLRDCAEEASRLKSEFLANMSHEIRTPMTVTLGMLEHVLSTALTEEQRECLQMAYQSAESLLHLIEGILDFSSIEAHHVQIRNESFNVRECAILGGSILQKEALKKGLALDLDIAPDVPTTVVGDKARIRQVMVNLVGNAIKFTETGQIIIRIERRPGESRQEARLAFSVIDTGIGIPEEKFETIFQSFTQLDNSATRKNSGIGLGLAICRELVKKMGGTLQVQSEVGKGSRFFFDIPVRLVTPEDVDPAG